MKDNLIIKLSDRYNVPIAKAKGTPEEIGKKMLSWMEKFK